MGFGSQPPPNPWRKPLAQPKASSWPRLVEYLTVKNPEPNNDPGLRQEHKPKLRDRDGYQCQLCWDAVDRSAPRDVMGERLKIHHIIPVANGGKIFPGI